MSFEERLKSGKFVVLAEMSTPKGVDVSQFETDARRIQGRIDAAVVPDMDSGVMRMSALAGGVLARQQGLEPIIHVYGRDRNRMAVQGDMLAAHALGIRNLLVVSGEDMVNCDHRDAAAVDDLDELGLLEAVASLQEGKDLAGFALDGAPRFFTGCSISPYADDESLAAELSAAREKVAAGARYIVAPPVFDAERFGELVKRAESLQTPIIATVFLIKSVAVARYIAANEPGSHISEEMILRIRKSPDREMEGVKIAGETIARLRSMAQGVLIQAMGWEHRLSAILEAAGM